MKKQSCQSKIKHTCGTKNFASCIDYQTDLPEFSELECPSIEETTEELYNLVGEIKEETDLSELGERCLEYLLDENDKIIVKNVLLKFEEKICELEEKINELENRPLCDQPLGDCIDTKCLVDACENPITTWGQLVQILIDRECETP
jgi:hypothetical protein